MKDAVRDVLLDWGVSNGQKAGQDGPGCTKYELVMAAVTPDILVHPGFQPARFCDGVGCNTDEGNVGMFMAGGSKEGRSIPPDVVVQRELVSSLSTSQDLPVTCLQCLRCSRRASTAESWSKASNLLTSAVMNGCQN